MLEEVEIDDLPSKERKKVEGGEVWCVIITREQFKEHLEEAFAALKPPKMIGEPPPRAR